MMTAYRTSLLVLVARLAAGAEVVGVCDLLKNPGQYKGRQVVVTAGYRVGFEWEALVCYDCETKGGIWVNFERDVKGGSKFPKVKAFDKLEKVTLQGTFEGPGHYGHLNGYKYQIQC